MAHTPKPLPYKAIAVLEDAMSLMKDAERLANAVQQAAVDGNKLEAVIVAGDIRTKAMLAHSLLVQARTGSYEK